MVRRIALLTILCLLAAAPLRAQETPTPAPATTTYVVRSGDTMGSIAARFGTSVSTLLRLNNLANPNLVVIGQSLLVPATVTPTPTGANSEATAIPVMPAASSTAIPVIPAVSATPAETATTAPETVTSLLPLAPTEPMPTAAPQGFDYGVEAFFGSEYVTSVAQQIALLGMHWAKVRVSWRAVEAVRGAPDFAALDEIVSALESRKLSILLTISDAPDWARSNTVENGPPDNFADFATFMNTLAGRYAGRVRAYEIWNEPNLRREWNNPLHPISAAAYADLLRAAYGAVKAADANATVVSAGLAPTGFDDGVNAVDDRKYLAQLYAAGLAAISDAVGAHPFGFGNPPDLVCCDAPPGVESHYGHPSFYFLDTLNDYHEIMLENDDADTLIWVTAFGWGTSADLPTPPPFNSRFVGYNSLEAQAHDLSRAFEIGARLHFVGVMILYNLNSCAIQPGNAEACYYSLIAPSGQPRPAYGALATIFGTAVER
jgi:LysM repeat protein